MKMSENVTNNSYQQKPPFCYLSVSWSTWCFHLHFGAEDKEAKWLEPGTCWACGKVDYNIAGRIWDISETFSYIFFSAIKPCITGIQCNKSELKLLSFDSITLMLPLSYESAISYSNCEMLSRLCFAISKTGINFLLVEERDLIASVVLWSLIVNRSSHMHIHTYIHCFK